jgi:maltooligosyltrehalose synthase
MLRRGRKNPDNPSKKRESPQVYVSKEDYEKYMQPNSAWQEVTLYNRKSKNAIHIDIKRPDIGKIGTPTIYDASGSTVPSGKPAFKWAPVTGGVTFENTDQKITTVTAKPASDSGLNAITTLTVTDTVCDIDDTVQFNVNYKP